MTNRIMELADRYATRLFEHNYSKADEARAALEAEVQRVEAVNAKLLEALQEMERAIRWVDHSVVNKAWDKARAAIAEATK